MRPSTDSEVAFTTPKALWATTSLYAVTGTTSLYADTGGCGRGLGGAEGLAGGADRCICFIDGAQTSISFADAEDLAGGADRCSCLFAVAETRVQTKNFKVY